MNLLFTEVAPLLLQAVMSAIRTLVAFAMLPIFASSKVPAMVRAGIAFAVVVPVVAARVDMPAPSGTDALALLTLLAREGSIGVVIGLGFGALCAGLQTAGELIDIQTGLTFTQNIDPTFGNNVSLTSQFFERVLFAALMSAGLMLVIVDALYTSYEVWPVGQPLPHFNRLVPLAIVGESSKVFSLALLLAGPVLLVLFVVDISLGMLNRAAPQLSVFQLALAMKPIVGLVVLAFALPMIIEHSLLAMGEFGKWVRALILYKG
jgi:type III secretion protein T